MGAVATWFDQTFIQPARFFFTGEYSGTEGNDVIVAVNIFGNWRGGEAKIYAGGGNDDIYLASIATTVYTGTGNDRIFGIAASMTVRDDWGNLEVYGAGGAFNVYKNGDGWIYVGAAAAYANIDSRGNGDVTFSGAAGYTNVTKVGNGHINFNGLAGGTRVYQSGSGDVNFYGAAGSNNVEKYGDGHIRFYGVAGGISVFQRGYGDVWINGAAGSANVRKEGHGNISFNGAAGGVSLNQSGNGDIYFAGAGGGVNVNKNGNGQITLYGAAASTNINQTGAGNIIFGGVGAHAQINKTGATGDVTIQGGVGNINVNYRQGGGNIVFQGAAGNINLTQDSGNIVLQGVVGATTVTKYNNGNIEFRGAVASANISQNGSGNVSFAGAAGGARVTQTGNGNISFAGVAGGVNVAQTGNGDIYFAGAGGGVNVNKSGNGQITLYGAAASTNINQTGAGNINFGGAGANVQINKTAQSRIQETINTTVWETRSYWWGRWYQYQVPVTRTETRWTDRTTGDVVVQGGVGNVNVNYSQGAGNIVFQGAAANVDLTHAKGDIVLYGAVGAATVNKTGDGNIDFKGAAGGIVLNHTGDSGTVSINGAAAYSKVVRRSSNSASLNNHIYFYGAGAYSNVLQQASGNIDFRGAGAANILTHAGAYGNTSFDGAGGANVITHSAQGNVSFNGAGVANVITHKGVTGNTTFNGAGGANIINHSAQGNVDFNGVGIANVILHTGSVGNANINAGGALNLVVRQGLGNLNVNMAALGNISVHIGNGNDRILQLGGLNTHTRIGDGDTLLGLAGGLNVATLVGNGSVFGGLLGAGNVVTKVGTGDTYLATVGAGNVISQIDSSNRSSQTAALLVGGANILTKYGQGDLYGLMAGGFNVATHVGTGNDYMAQLGGGNILTKVGQGNLMAAQFGIGNILTHVGDGTSLGMMAGGGNAYTKVGNGLSASLMLGTTANVFTHVGSGDSLAIMASQGGNLFTKVDVNSTAQSTDITAAAMLGSGNTFTHVGSGTTGALMLAGGNLFTKVGDGNTAAAMIGVGNIATHVGNGTLFAVMGGVPAGVPSGNVLTKVGNGTTVGVMAASGNIFTHIGDGNTTGIALGQGNIITKVGKGDQVNAVLGQGNVLTHVTLNNNGTNSTQATSNNSYNLAVGKGNIVTKVGDGKQVSALVGQGNIVTHVGNGDAINLSVGGTANVMTKVGNGNTVTGIFNSKVNIVTHVGNGNDYQGIWGQANVVTKVGDGTSASAMKGSANVITAVGDGAQVGILAGDLNVVTKVGDGVSVNLMKGKGNINTKVGDGASVAVMMGMGNANIQVGDGTTAFVAYANNNISIKVGNGDYYGFAFAKGKATVLQNAQALGRNILQSAAGFVGSGVISQLIWGADETGHGNSNEADVTASVLAEPTTTEPKFDFAEHQSMPVFKSKSSDVQVAEPGTNSTLTRDNIESINSSQQSQQTEASRSAAKAAEQAIKTGIDNSRADVNALFSALENAVGDGGVLQSTLNTATTALVDRLSTLDRYVGKLDESLKTQQSSSRNGEFANGLISHVNTQLDSTLQGADDALSQSDKAVGDAKLQIEKVKQDAQTRQTVAADAKGDALVAKQSADQQKSAAENRVTGTQTQANTQVNGAQTRVNGVNSTVSGAKLTDADKPTGRTAVKGSGLTGTTTALDSIDPFTNKSDAVLNTSAVAIVNGSQQATLHSGVSGVTIAPQLLGGQLSDEQEEDEEDDDEGGLTDEQIAALHEAERANNNLGLKGHWKDSTAVKQWLDDGHELASSIRGRKRGETQEAAFKRVIGEISSGKTGTKEGLNDRISDIVDDYLRNNIKGQTVKLVLGNNSDAIVRSYIAELLTYDQATIANLKFEDVERSILSDLTQKAIEIKSNDLFTQKNKTEDSRILFGMLEAFFSIKSGKANTTDFDSFIDKVKSEYNASDEDMNKILGDSNLLKTVFDQNELVLNTLDKTKGLITTLSIYANGDNELFWDLKAKGVDFTAKEQDVIKALDTVANNVIVNGSKLANFVAYYNQSKQVLLSSLINTNDYQNKIDQKKQELASFKDDDEMRARFVGDLDLLSGKEGRSSYLNLSNGSGAGSGVQIGKLFDDNIRKNYPDLGRYLNQFVSGAERTDSENAIRDFFKVGSYDAVVQAATDARGLITPQTNKSKNHILADTFIKLILSDVVANSGAGLDSTKEAALKALVDSLVGVGDLVLEATFGKTNLEALSKKAMDQLAVAITSKNANQFGNVIKALDEVYKLVSYAPGNIRYGDGSINGQKSNYFDAPLIVKEVVTSSGEKILVVSYMESATSIADALEKMQVNGVISNDVKKYATLSDFKDGVLYSSSEIVLEDSTGKRSPIALSNGKLIFQVDLAADSRMNQADTIVLQGKLKESFDFAKTLEAQTPPPYVNKAKITQQYGVDATTSVLKPNTHAGSNNADIEPSSDIDKVNKRIDYQITHQATTEAGDKLTVYKIIDLDGGPAVYRVQIDVNGDETQRISVFMSDNPLQTDGSIRLPSTTTLMTHGEKIAGDTYTSKLDSQYLVDDEKYLSISANDFRNVDNLEAAESVAKNSQTNNYLLTKYRGEDEGLGINMAKHQEEVMLAALRDRADADKAAMGYMTVGKHTKISSAAAEAALSRFGVSGLINGYCRVPAGTPENADTIRVVRVKDEALATHHQGERAFANDIERTVTDIAIIRQTDLEGRRTAAAEATLKKAGVIGSKIQRHALYMKLKLAVPAMNYKSPINTNGNIQLQVGDGEYTAGFWGNTNIGVKVGDGGFKTLAFGDNNAMIHIGDGDNAQHTVKVADYTAFESVQVFVGEHNLSYNQGRSNDFIVMMDKSIPLAPFQSPLNGPSDIVGFLKNDIANFKLSQGSIDPLTGGSIEDNYYDSQSFLWTNNNAKQIIDQISALDMNSAVEYTTLFDYGSENDRSDRALKADLERKANGMLNQAIAGQNPLSMAKNRNVKDQNFNITIAGQGSDILIANGDNQFMFGDNAQSIMDTTVASLFGILSQDVGRNGQVSNPLSVSGGKNAKDAFLNTLKNLAQDTFSRVMARTAAGLPDMSFGEAFGLDYKADGQLIVENTIGASGIPSAQELVGYADSGMQGMMGVLGNFGNSNLGSYLNSSRLVDTLRTAVDKGPEALAGFRDSLLGVETKEDASTPEAPADSNPASGTQQPANDAPTQPTVPTMKSSEVFGFGALKLPSIFDFDISAGFSAIPDMVNNLVGTLGSFDGDIETMKTQMFDFFSKSGYMQGDGDLMLSLGNNNFAWGGDGADVAAFMGLNNNFWGGRGNDMYYGIGENNQASGNDGDDTAILLGINNIFFGGDGKDFALASGRNGNLAGGEGDDTLYALGDTSWLNGGAGNDYLVAVGNYNGIDGGEGNDFAVSIGNFADVDLGAGHDIVSIFGNASSIKTGAGDDLLRLMGHKSQLYAGDGNDFIWAESEARDNTIEGNAGDDTFVLGGGSNIFYGGEGLDTFIINDSIINVHVADIDHSDQLIFSDMSFDKIWFARRNTDLVVNLDNELGSTVTLDNYFGQVERADIVVGTLANTEGDQPQYEVLSADALNQLIQVMASYDIVGEEDGFMSGVSSQDKQIIATAWDKTIVKSGSTFTAFV